MRFLHCISDVATIVRLWRLQISASMTLQATSADLPLDFAHPRARTFPTKIPKKCLLQNATLGEFLVVCVLLKIDPFFERLRLISGFFFFDSNLSWNTTTDSLRGVRVRTLDSIDMFWALELSWFCKWKAIAALELSLHVMG